MDEKKPASAQELNDEELGRVAGGKSYWEWQGKYYKYSGDYFDISDWNKSYLCPRCGYPVYYSWPSYHCDSCRDSWHYEEDLVPNVARGPWEEISSDEYRRATS